MKTYKNILLALSLSAGLVSCDYLDIIPDEKPTESDAFEDVSAAERYIYSCYAYLPKPNDGPQSLDFMTGDEIVTAFEHETFASFPKGNYSASRPVISYWNTFFQGIRQCYIFLNNIDKTPDLTEEVKKDYKAQANFLIGYYHYLLSRCYGPIILVKEEPSILTNPNDYLPRTNYDECVEFICQKMDEAMNDLPEKRPVRYYGLATSIVAKSIKAKMLLYAASPLFNGNNEFFSDFVDKNGNNLMPLQYDANKWVKAKEAFKVAIDAAHAANHELYTTPDMNEGNREPLDPTQHCLRYTIMDKGNSEIIWADSRGEGTYGLQNKSLPFSSGSAWNGVAPTLTMLKRFYTKNGLPIEEDPEFDTNNMFRPVSVTEEEAIYAKPGTQTLAFNMNREPRFYAWVTFHNGYFEVLNASTKAAYKNYREGGTDNNGGYIGSEGAGKVVCNFLQYGNCSRQPKAGENPRSNNYAPTGYLNKKGVNPAFEVSTDLKGPLDFPWPIIRLAELYLGYAEACVETNDLEEAKRYINVVRERAGIPTVEEAWAITGKALDQARLRQIVRQERQIEFYLENQNFWDLRRWKIAEQYFNVKVQGMNISAATIENFGEIQEVIFERKFEAPTQYLLPIPLADVQKNEKLVQNPGY